MQVGLGVRARARATGSSRATASRRSACCAGCPPRRCSRGGAAIPTGWWNPADYSVASICVPIATHVRTPPGSPGARSCAASRPARSRTSATARPPRARSTRARTSPRVMQAPLVLFCNNNQWAISTPLAAQTARARRSPTRRPATACRACASTAPTCSPSTRRRARQSSGRAPATGRRSSRRSPTARRRTRPPTTRASTSTRSGSRRRRRASASGGYEGYLRRRGLLDDERVERSGPRPPSVMRAGIAAAEAEPPADPELIFDHALRRPAALADDSRSCGGSAWLS